MLFRLDISAVRDMHSLVMLGMRRAMMQDKNNQLHVLKFRD